MDARTFEQRLAEMHRHEQRFVATLGHAQTARRLAEKRADAAEGHVATLKGIVGASAKVSEPLTYRRGGEHSFFYDLVRAQRSIKGAAERLARHRREMDVELPKRAEARARAAATAYEAAFYSTPADRRAMDAALAAGFRPFERRGISTTPSQGGYLAPPVYLVDEYVPFARAAAAFSSDWHPMVLPPATSEVNVPRLAVGTGTGPQNDLAPVVSRDIQDSLVSTPVRQVAGNADVSYQWLEQGSGSAGHGVDEMIYADLTADIAQNTDGQALLGSNTSGQLLGVWPAGAIAAANGILQADTSTTSSQTWTVASEGNSLHVNAAQLVSLARRIRNRGDGWSWYWHPWTWSLYTAQVDSQGRPLVNDQCGDLPDGVAGYYQNIPVRLDANIPTTFGGATSAPYIGPITDGQYAAYPGVGSGNSYTPLLLARPDDLFMFTGEIRLRLLEQVLSGAGMARFQADQYLAAMPNRYVAAAAVGSTVSAGGDVGHGTLTWQETQSLLILSGSGY
jgi:HK97 family phage major capsid protein